MNEDLRRFIDAQDDAYDDAREELRRGQKTGHWMWFIFPQLRGLGRSQMALKYGIASRREAEDYLNHPILGGRLRECAGLVNAVDGKTISEIFGYPDDLKFKSSMTLFADVAHARTSARDGRVFEKALEKYFKGEKDALTLSKLAEGA